MCLRTVVASVLVCAVLLVSGCAYGKYMRQGDDAYARGDYEAALTHYEAAVAADPDSAEAAEKVRQTRERIVAGHADKARSALAAGDLLGAMVSARRAWDRLPDAAATTAIVQEVSNATLAEAQRLATTADYANALMLYQTLGETLPSEVDKAAPHAEDVRVRWARVLEEGAAAAEADGRKGDALLHWAKLTDLTRDPAHGGRRDALRNEILNEWGYWVQLSGKGRDAYEHLVAGLSGVSPQTALRVAERLPAGVTPRARARFDLGRPIFRTDQSSRTATVQYQSGTQQVENPFYRSKQDRLLDEERRLVDRQNEVTGLENDVMRYEEAVQREGDTPNVTTGAEQNLSNARSRLESARRGLQDQRNAVQRAREDLAREPQTREEPVYADHTYTITTHTRLAQMDLRGTISHEDGRPPITVQETAQVQVSDDEHPAQDIAGVAADPLALPNDLELAAQLYGAAEERARAAIAESFSAWRAALVQQAVAASDDDRRVDLLVIYIVTNPREVLPQVAADLSALRGIRDSVRILRP